MKYLIIIPAVLFVFSACDRNRNTTGWDYFPDMAYSHAYESFSDNPNFADNNNFRKPVEGTIPRGIIPFQYEKTEEEMLRAGKELTNPVEYNTKTRQDGQDAYNTYCIQCHGEKGDGQGNLYTSGKYPFPPASLVNEKMQKKPEGEFFHQITLGYGIMGAHGSIIRPLDRWKIIHFIKNDLQKK